VHRLNLRHLCEPLVGAEGLLEMVGDEEQARMPYWRGSNTETAGSKGCVEPRNWSQGVYWKL